MIEQANPSLDLIFSKKIDTVQNYLMKVPLSFLQQLKQNGEFVIQGGLEQNVITSSDQNCYRMKGIKLSTTMMTIDEKGTIMKQSDFFVEVEEYEPEYHVIYRKLYDKSCQSLPQDLNVDYSWLIEEYGFSLQQFLAWSQLHENGFRKFKEKLGFVKSKEDDKYLYISLPLAVQLLRAIISWMNQERIPLLEPISYEPILKNFPILSLEILDYLSCFFKSSRHHHHKFQITPQAICIYVSAELAVAKSHYNQKEFNELYQEMLAIYMPAQIDCRTQQIHDYSNLARLDFFIEKRLSGGAHGMGSGSTYIFYDFMELDSNLLNRLNFLNSFKKRYSLKELEAIFRGMEVNQNGKSMELGDILLRKFRKFGDEYEIKFVLPK